MNGKSFEMWVSDKNSFFDGASIERMELCVKGKVSQDLVGEIHKVIRRLVEEGLGLNSHK